MFRQYCPQTASPQRPSSPILIGACESDITWSLIPIILYVLYAHKSHLLFTPELRVMCTMRDRAWGITVRCTLFPSCHVRTLSRCCEAFRYGETLWSVWMIHLRVAVMLRPFVWGRRIFQRRFNNAVCSQLYHRVPESCCPFRWSRCFILVSSILGDAPTWFGLPLFRTCLIPGAHIRDCPSRCWLSYATRFDEIPGVICMHYQRTPNEDQPAWITRMKMPSYDFDSILCDDLLPVIIEMQLKCSICTLLARIAVVNLYKNKKNGWEELNATHITMRYQVDQVVPAFLEQCCIRDTPYSGCNFVKKRARTGRLAITVADILKTSEARFEAIQIVEYLEILDQRCTLHCAVECCHLPQDPVFRGRGKCKKMSSIQWRNYNLVILFYSVLWCTASRDTISPPMGQRACDSTL